MCPQTRKKEEDELLLALLTFDVFAHAGPFYGKTKHVFCRCDNIATLYTISW